MSRCSESESEPAQPERKPKSKKNKKRENRKKPRPLDLHKAELNKLEPCLFDAPDPVDRQKYMGPGRKRQRGTGGGYKDLDPNRLFKHVEKKAYDIPPSVLLPEQLAKLTPKPVSKDATDLVEDYFHRDHFWFLVYVRRVPIERAGQIALGLQKVQSYKVHKELDKFAGEHQPYKWFCAEAFRLILAGKIGHGAVTEPSPMADVFFLALLHPNRNAYDLVRFRHGGETQAIITLKCERGANALEFLRKQTDDYFLINQRHIPERPHNDPPPSPKKRQRRRHRKSSDE